MQEECLHRFSLKILNSVYNPTNTQNTGETLAHVLSSVRFFVLPQFCRSFPTQNYVVQSAFSGSPKMNIDLILGNITYFFLFSFGTTETPFGL